TDEFFSCPFLVFELDNIKDHPVIFPVATLIIMDIFLKKMRRLKNTRKVICIEEAWVRHESRVNECFTDCCKRAAA
ncbi:MAG: hypothetical protein ACK5HT_21615, partial [Draconibacterium sp.]